MGITGDFNRQALIDWSQQLLSATADRRDQPAVETVTEAVQALQADRFCLAILGKAKRGKSTLLNAILGRTDDRVAPIDKLPASSAISRFRWADTERATVVFQDGRRQTIGFDRIREFVTEDCNKDNAKGVHVVEIEGPFPGLDRDLALVDTPGAGSIHEHHDALLHAFIPQADAVIFLVTARMPLDQDELDLLQKVKSADIAKVFFAVNQVDLCSEQDLADAIDHNTRLLSQIGIHITRMHRISAKNAFHGDLRGSGVSSLLEDISALIAGQKGRVLSARFVSRVCGAIAPISQALEVEAASSRKSVEELDTELTKLREQKRTIEREREFTEREFTNAWTQAVDLYSRGLKDAQNDVQASVMSKVEGTSVFEVSALARQLPSLLTKTIEDQLRPLASRFEESVQTACDRLQATYPELNVGEAGGIAVRTREGQTAITGAIGGAAAAATGVGLAAAGASAAAAIAAANAAAAAATTTVAAPSVLAGILSLAGLEVLAPLATGTATVAAPTALSTAPLWVALAGPVGWTLAGVGILAVPFSWRLSKLKMKDKIVEASEEQIKKVFDHLQTERLPAIRKMGQAIVEEVRLKLDRQLAQIESAIIAARDRRPSESEALRLADLNLRLRGLLQHAPAMLEAADSRQ